MNKNFESGVDNRDNLSAPSSIIEKAHNELYAFYTGKGDFLKKNLEANRGRGRPIAFPFESATVCFRPHRIHTNQETEK